MLGTGKSFHIKYNIPPHSAVAQPEWASGMSVLQSKRN